jgi:hypothetical protein
MNRRTQFFWQLAGLPFLLIGLCQHSLGKWAQPVEAPLERLLRNTQTYLQKNPNDAQGYYVLGRLHSLAFARQTQTLSVYESNAQRPLTELPPYESILIARDKTKPPTAAALQHLSESIRQYQRATELAPAKAAAWLGLGWMWESGAEFAAEVSRSKGGQALPSNTSAWQTRALAAYRQAYARSVKQDLAREHAGPGANAQISLEAGQAIQRLLQNRAAKPTVQEQAELLEIGNAITQLQHKPRVVTPIIFSLTQARPLTELLAPGTCVRFDLSGDGQPRLWPWVKPETGLLVWDQTRQGRVRSGVQLFGSSTWWIAWEHGYQPLALLDDNGDGWLAGAELHGLAVWRDRNTNGVSEPGEVAPVRQLGIRRLAVQATTTADGVPANPNGLELNDGRRLPTYDWTPTEIKEPALARAQPTTRWAQRDARQ